jgi:hypothetical protein
MATLGGLALTYGDWAKRLDPDGKTATIVEILSQTNDILKDMLVIEGNLPTGHQTTVRTGLPQATWRLLNQGVQPTRSTTAQITDTCGMLETYSDIDIDLANLNGNSADFRVSEDQAFLEGMNQQMASAVIYSNSLSTPQQILGLQPRFSTVNTNDAQSANNVIDCGGTGSTNTSIWMLVWGPNTCAGLFPKGSVAGLQHRDLGEQTLYTAVGSSQTQLQVYRTHYQWKAGLCVRDWRYVTRMCNIDVSQLLTGNAANLSHALLRAANKLPTAPSSLTAVQATDAPNGGQMNMGQTVIYNNRVINTYLSMQATDKSNVLLEMGQWAGEPVLMYRGVPVRTVDAILNTESRVV